MTFNRAYALQRTCKRCKQSKAVAGGITGGRGRAKLFICAACIKARKEKEACVTVKTANTSAI